LIDEHDDFVRRRIDRGTDGAAELALDRSSHLRLRQPVCRSVEHENDPAILGACLERNEEREKPE
jgi:hypothetical protein